MEKKRTSNAQVVATPLSKALAVILAALMAVMMMTPAVAFADELPGDETQTQQPAEQGSTEPDPIEGEEGAGAEDGTPQTTELMVTNTAPVVADGDDEQGLVSVFASRAETTWYYDHAESTQFTITSAEELLGLSELVNTGVDNFAGKTIALTSDFSLASFDEWTPIGAGIRSGAGYTTIGTGLAFKGVFEGNNHTISGLTITATQNASVDYAYGLFGVVDGGTVKNLTLTEVHINVPTSQMAGAFIGQLTGGGTALNLIAGQAGDGSTVTAQRGNGGIVGRMTGEGTIQNCTNNAAINGTGANIGGIVGAAYYTQAGKEMNIVGCVNYGRVTGTGSAASMGGIAGLSTANVTSCTNAAPVTGVTTTSSCSVGGIVGEQQVYGTVSGNTNIAEATITGSLSGGIIGWLRYASYSAGNYGNTQVIQVTNNTNHASIVGADSGNSLAAAGGIVGIAQDFAFINNNKSYASSLTSGNFIGGTVASLRLGGGSVSVPAPPYAGQNAPIIEVNDNLSTTPLTSMQATGTTKCVALHAWNNNPTYFSVFDNYTEEASSSDEMANLINSIINTDPENLTREQVNAVVSSIAHANEETRQALATAEFADELEALEQAYIAANSGAGGFVFEATTYEVDESLQNLGIVGQKVVGGALSLEAPTSAAWDDSHANHAQFSLSAASEVPLSAVEDELQAEDGIKLLFDLTFNACNDDGAVVSSHLQPTVPLFVTLELDGSLFTEDELADLVVYNFHANEATGEMVIYTIPVIAAALNEAGNYEITLLFSQLSTVLVGVKGAADPGPGTDPGPSKPDPGTVVDVPGAGTGNNGTTGGINKNNVNAGNNAAGALAHTGDTLNPVYLPALVAVVLVALGLLLAGALIARKRGTHNSRR